MARNEKLPLKKIHNLQDKKTLRQKLRHSATPVEKRLWHGLKKSAVGAKFRRQHGVGPYVLDFYCPELKLAIEIQGGVHQDVLRRDSDAERHAYLESEGIRVLYFENRELLELPEFVVGVIRSAIETSLNHHPSCPGGASAKLDAVGNAGV